MGILTRRIKHRKSENDQHTFEKVNIRITQRNTQQNPIRRAVNKYNAADLRVEKMEPNILYKIWCVTSSCFKGYILCERIKHLFVYICNDVRETNELNCPASKNLNFT